MVGGWKSLRTSAAAMVSGRRINLVFPGASNVRLSLHTAGVTGSIPVPPTNISLKISALEKTSPFPSPQNANRP